MEKQFNSESLTNELGALTHARANGYKLAREAGQVIVQIYSGKFPLSAFVYDSDIHANHDIGMLQEWLPDLKELTDTEEAPQEKPAATEGIDTSKLPADFKPKESNEPGFIRDQKLAAEISGLKAAKLTGYKMAVTDAPYPYALSLMRGNSVAFHYDYLQHEDRANDLGFILDELPDLQLVGAPDFVS